MNELKIDQRNENQKVWKQTDRLTDRRTVGPMEITNVKNLMFQFNVKTWPEQELYISFFSPMSAPIFFFRAQHRIGLVWFGFMLISANKIHLYKIHVNELYNSSLYKYVKNPQ